MNSRKRRAPEPLLPLRSSKQPRTAFSGHGSGKQSPSELVGIQSRWAALAKQMMDLVYDTVLYAKGTVLESKPEAPPDCLSLTRSRNLLPTTDTEEEDLEEEKAQGDDVSDDQTTVAVSKSDAEKTSATPSAPPLTPTPSPTRDKPFRTAHEAAARFRSVNTEHQRDHSATGERTFEVMWNAVSDDKSRSLNSIPSFTTTTTSVDSIRPPFTPTSTDSPSKGLSSKTTPTETRKRAKPREHIYAKAHKATLANSRRLRKLLYQEKRRNGFTSGFADFEGLLLYQQKLASLSGNNALISPDDGGLKIPLRGGLLSSSSFTTEDDDNKFIQRALEAARRTFNEPKPPPPFIPSFEQLEISRRQKDDAIEQRLRPSRPPLPTHLPPADESKVKAILTLRGVVSKFAKEQVTDQDVSRLKPGQWLNDEIINFYGALILSRAEECKENPGANGKVGKEKSKPLNAHYFSTFFWSKLTKEGYDKGRLAKWTKKIDIFSKDVILIPVNHSNAHWTAAAINFRQKRVESYDSMGLAKEVVFKSLRAYIDAEHRNKKKKPFDFTGWENWAPDDTPQQENGFDCGVFTCQFLEALSRGEASFGFTQKDMSYLRRRMIWEIGTASLRDDP